jgi:hypothetical protein
MKNIAGRVLIAVLLWASACGTGWAAQSYKMTSIALLQPESVIDQRVSDRTAFAGYIQSINAAVLKRLDTLKNAVPAGATIFVAVRPNGTSKTWPGSTPKLPADIVTAVTTAADSVKPADVSGGTVVIAINVSLWGGEPPAGLPTSMPEEWSAAVVKAGGKTVEVTQIVDSIWPAK